MAYPSRHNSGFRQRDRMRAMETLDAEQHAKLADDFSNMAEWIEAQLYKVSEYGAPELHAKIKSAVRDLRAAAFELRRSTR